MRNKAGDDNAAPIELKENIPKKEEQVIKPYPEEFERLKHTTIQEIKERIKAKHKESHSDIEALLSLRKIRDSINSEIEEIIKEDEELKKAQNQDLTIINIKNDWEVKKYFDAQLKQFLSADYKDLVAELNKRGIDHLRFCYGISPLDLLRLYRSMIISCVDTIAVKFYLKDRFLVEYGIDFTLLHQMQTPENAEDLRVLSFLNLCTNKPGTEKAPKHPILILKVITKTTEEEINTIKTYLAALAHRFIDNECFVLLADAQKVIFLRYDGSQNSKLWVSKEYKEDLLAEFGKLGKEGKITEDSETLYKILFCILNVSMEKCEKFLKARNFM